MKSLKQLATTTGATSIRLWGKIHGTEKDYYIAEGQWDGGVNEEEEKPADYEARGSGINKFAYWATNSPTEAWTQLPDLKTKNLIAARQIKVLMTGNLEAKIMTNPFFFATEKFYLRAQIARISHSTSLVPKGYYRMVEESNVEIEENTPEEGPIPIPSTHAMGDCANWVHHSQSILKIGRVSLQDPEMADGDERDPEEVKKEMEKQDPSEKRLKSISDDDRVKGELPAWVVRLAGECDTFSNANPAVNARSNYGVAYARSLWWPGAYNFFSSSRWTSIYVGNGLKYEKETYYPVCPPVILDDPVEKETHAEPCGKDPAEAAPEGDGGAE